MSPKKTDADRGHFAVTERLEAWAKEQQSRRAKQDGSKYQTDRRTVGGGIVIVPPSGETEVLSPVALRPDDVFFEPTGFKLGVGVNLTMFPYKTLVAIEATDPWPSFEIEWRHMSGQTRRRYRPRFDKEREAWAAVVEKLFEHAGRHFDHLLRRGWLDAPIVPWEEVGLFPDERLHDEEERGGYRLSAKERPREEIIARRGAPKPFEALLDWLASSPSYPWAEHPREVLVSESHVYVRRRDGRVYRLPVSTLRIARKNDQKDASYVFGRNTTLLLPHRKGCEVMTALDAVLT